MVFSTCAPGDVGNAENVDPVFGLLPPAPAQGRVVPSSSSSDRSSSSPPEHQLMYSLGHFSSSNASPGESPLRKASKSGPVRRKTPPAQGSSSPDRSVLAANHLSHQPLSMRHSASDLQPKGPPTSLELSPIPVLPGCLAKRQLNPHFNSQPALSTVTSGPAESLSKQFNSDCSLHSQQARAGCADASPKKDRRNVPLQQKFSIETQTTAFPNQRPQKLLDQDLKSKHRT